MLIPSGATPPAPQVTRHTMVGAAAEISTSVYFGQPSRLRQQIHPLRYAGGAISCKAVMLDRTLAVARSFEQMATYRIQAMVAQKAWVGFESFEARKARHRTVNHRECHSMVQGDHRVVFHP